jgi:hypothetical protein
MSVDMYMDNIFLALRESVEVSMASSRWHCPAERSHNYEDDTSSRRNTHGN